MKHQRIAEIMKNQVWFSTTLSSTDRIQARLVHGDFSIDAEADSLDDVLDIIDRKLQAKLME